MLFKRRCQAVQRSWRASTAAALAQVRALVRDSLRHWALEYDVDGFCFVNAETLAQGKGPPLAASTEAACAAFLCYGITMRCSACVYIMPGCM